MKNQILGIVFAVIILPIGGVLAQDHASHEASNDETAIKRFEVSEGFQKQINAVYKASLELNKAFVESNVATVKERAATMIHRVTEVDMSLVKGDAHIAWMNYMKPLSDELGKISVSDDLVAQRKSYAIVSNDLYKVVKAFGVGEPVYYMYCPMAKSNWLNDSKEVNNPYYGEMMLRCGSAKEVLN